MQRKILVSYELARWTFAWNVRRKPSVSSWVWQPAVRLAATTRRFTNRGDPRITFSWTISWCRRRSTGPSRNARAGGRKTLVRRRSSNRPPVSRPPHYCRARSADQTGLSSVDQRRRRPLALSAHPATSSKTIRIQIRRAVSTLPGEDPRSCNSWLSPAWSFVIMHKQV